MNSRHSDSSAIAATDARELLLNGVSEAETVGVPAAETLIEVLVSLFRNMLDLIILAEIAFVFGVEKKRICL